MFFRFDDFDRSSTWFDELQRRLAQAIQAPEAHGLRSEFDMHETDDALVITADLPGVSEKDLEITLHEDVLTVTASRKLETPEGQKVLVSERRPFKFTRTFSLPISVDENNVKAKLQNGVLCLTLKKAQAAMPRQIPVSVNE